jgi:excisionase family DNA binding protein
MRKETDNTITADPLLTVDELAARLRLKRSWVYTHADELGGYRLGKYLRFSWARVLERLERVTETPQLGRQPNAPS